MKSMLMAIMAVAVTFSVPAFAYDVPGDGTKDEKKGGHVVVYGDQKDEKKKDGK